jgi:hypothetical protein
VEQLVVDLHYSPCSLRSPGCRPSKPLLASAEHPLGPLQARSDTVEARRGGVVQEPDSGENTCSDETESTHAHHLSSSSSKVSEEVEVVGRTHAVVDDVGTEEGGVGCTNCAGVGTVGAAQMGMVEAVRRRDRRWSGGGAGHWRPRPRLEANKRAAAQGEHAGGGAAAQGWRSRAGIGFHGDGPRTAYMAVLIFLQGKFSTTLPTNWC